MDESGFMLQPLVRRTWAPRGETPSQYSWDRRDRLSGIAALTLSPVRDHFGLYFQLHASNIHAEEVIAFLKRIHQHLGRNFILILDRYSVHRHAVRLLQEAGVDWLEVEWLPSYAPELNPVEMVWNHTKYGDLANFIPDDIDHLRQEVDHSIEGIDNEQDLLRSFFSYTGLAL